MVRDVKAQKGAVVVLWLLLASPAVGAQAPGLDQQVAGLLSRFDAPDWQERDRAFRELLGLSRATNGTSWAVPAKMPDLLERLPARADQMKLALIRLLEKENAAWRTTRSRTEQSTEYQADLLGAVASLRDSRALGILLDNLETGAFAMRAVAALVPEAVEPLLKRLDTGTPSARQVAVLSLGYMLDADVVRPRVVDSQTHAKIKEALLRAADDDSFWVRVAAIQGLAKIPGDDVTAKLTRLAEQDPYVGPGAPAQPPVYFVRERARDALRARR